MSRLPLWRYWGRLLKMNSAMSSSRPGSSHILVAIIISMIARNGIARALNNPRPYSTDLLNEVRTKLLADPFFDPDHRPEELRPRVRMSRINFDDALVLFAKLLKVLMARVDPPTEEQQRERALVRNEVLSHPFFDRKKAASSNPFSEAPFEDEGCFT
ncbi:hypothetical protein M433DRAFT_394641 [Acidomyces richmondensis BFW]|nr:MAG: hypothetical protein FE78DRAFT_202756 [Acidomyces sp. 'richmondensis']KYG48695.1 hypothetical protein M433DRAFT_394641 [Acidomyces richmondensis BFW]